MLDQHCHGVRTEDLDRANFEANLGEGRRGHIDSALGLAVRRFCAPVLDLEAHASADDYLARRAELGWREASTRLLRGAGVTTWLIDSGFWPEPDAAQHDTTLSRARNSGRHPLRDNAAPITAPHTDKLAAFGALAGTVGEVVRLEQVAEQVIAERRHSPLLFAEIENTLRERANDAVGFKTVAAYRCGLHFPSVEFPPSTIPADHRITDPELIGWLVGLGARLGAELGLPLQIHTGFGDPDLRLDHADPLLLTDFLRATADTGLTVVLLHCWPFHRNAAYLAHLFDHVHLDLGLTIPHVGARAGAVLAETLELAPFGALGYSSDGFALPELHYLAALLWRRGLGRLLDDWLAEDLITTVDAEAMVTAIASGNARRIYPVDRVRVAG
nr:amidohydrolase family protein [Nocardia bovistercoris]